MEDVVLAVHVLIKKITTAKDFPATLKGTRNLSLLVAPLMAPERPVSKSYLSQRSEILTVSVLLSRKPGNVSMS